MRFFFARANTPGSSLDHRIFDVEIYTGDEEGEKPDQELISRGLYHLVPEGRFNLAMRLYLREAMKNWPPDMGRGRVVFPAPQQDFKLVLTFLKELGKPGKEKEEDEPKDVHDQTV